MTNTPTYSSDPIPGPAVPDGYTALGQGDTVQEGDRFLSSDGFWKRTEMDGTKLPFGGLEYARPDAVTLILENERRVVATASRVPELLSRIADLESTIRDQATTIRELEDDNQSYRDTIREMYSESYVNSLLDQIDDLKNQLSPRT